MLNRADKESGLIAMGFWNFYFLLKLFLYAQGYLGFHPWKNLGFAIFLLVPLTQPRLVALRWMLSVPIGIALLYHDSLLPSFARVWSQFDNIAAFGGDYLLELLARIFNWRAVLAFFALLGAYIVANRYLRATTFVLVALLAVAAKQEYVRFFPAAAEPVALAQAGQTNAQQPILPAATDANLNQHFDAFFASETNRRVSFARPQAAFDIVFIHICSLAWDDLKTLSLDTHPLFKKFDVLFREFNSAASYSGPAVIRLLRGNCGQRRHGDLYDNDSQQCFTFDALRQVGFESQWLMNHDGHYGRFRDDVALRGGLGVQPLDNTRAAVTMHSFDNTPIYDDYDELSRWWSRRLVSESAQVALYYNSISLHDGNKMPGGGRSLQTYPRRAEKVIDEIDRFMALLESSGRRVVVVMVPEHGAALSGDSAQISGMREIPTPQITLVPVGVKFIGMAADDKHVVNNSTSYLALTALLAKTMAQYRPGAALKVADLISDLPATPYVAENEELAIMKYGANYYSRNSDGVWVRSE